MWSSDYWLRWQVLVCALIIVIPTIVFAILISRIQRAPLNAYYLWIPCWRGLNPLWLLTYRALVFVFMSWLLYQAVAQDGAWAFYFYTQWTFTLVIIYFLLATIVSAHGCWKYSKTIVATEEERNCFLKKNLEETEPRTTSASGENKVDGTITSQHNLDQQIEEAGFWGYLMQAVYQTSASASMLTDIVFWCLLLPFQSEGQFSLNPLMASMHSLNAVFLIIDASLNNLTFPWFRLAYFVFWSCLYIVFQWISHACGISWWPYAFLELSTPWAPIWYLSMCLIHIPSFAFFVLVVKVKNFIFSRLFPQAYIGSH